MLFSAPYITTIQPPAPVQNAMSGEQDRQVPGRDDLAEGVEAEAPAAGSRPG